MIKLLTIRDRDIIRLCLHRFKKYNEGVQEEFKDHSFLLSIQEDGRAIDELIKLFKDESVSITVETRE